MAFAPYNTVSKKEIRVPYSANYPIDQCAVFSMHNVSKNTAADEDAWWQLLVTSVTEEHEENADLHETLANSVVSFALGPKPVYVTISGYLLTGGPADDHFGKFFHTYLSAFRANRLSLEERLLKFSYKGTSFSLFIESLGVSQASGQDDYTEVYIDGYACHYSAYTVKSSTAKSNTSEEIDPEVMDLLVQVVGAEEI